MLFVERVVVSRIILFPILFGVFLLIEVCCCVCACVCVPQRYIHTATVFSLHVLSSIVWTFCCFSHILFRYIGVSISRNMKLVENKPSERPKLAQKDQRQVSVLVKPFKQSVVLFHRECGFSFIESRILISLFRWMWNVCSVFRTEPNLTPLTNFRVLSHLKL